MATHPLNLILRFLLEITVLFAVAYWAYNELSSLWDINKFALGIGMPLCLAIVWGLFNVPGDTSRSGRAPIPVAGWKRLLLETCFFSLGVWAVFEVFGYAFALAFAMLIAAHYLSWLQRVKWLLRSK